MDSRFDDTVSLDERLDAFEGAWRNALTPPSIWEFLPTLESPHRVRAIVELVMIDLERRLRRERQSSSEGADSMGECRWLIEGYLRDFPELLQTTGLLGELVCFDARLRVSLGSPLDLDDYHSRLSVYAQLFEQDLRNAFAEMAAVTLSWFRGDCQIWRGPLPPILELGRAIRGEPPAPCQSVTPSGVRLTIATVEDVSISRRQLLVEVIAPHRIRITNTSRNVACGLVNGSRHMPGCTMDCDSSTSMRIGSGVLVLDFPAWGK